MWTEAVSWPNLRYCPGFWLEGLRKTTTPVSQDGRYPCRALNTGAPEYEEKGSSRSYNVQVA
jgi:hypothetical protein